MTKVEMVMRLGVNHFHPPHIRLSMAEKGGEHHVGYKKRAYAELSFIHRSNSTRLPC
jgi:hypothetical protein